MNITILANGTFPSHPTPLQAILEADRLICCDAAYDKLLQHLPSYSKPVTVVGDMDSIGSTPDVEYQRIDEQVNNDLTKSVHYALEHYNPSCITIVGATGLREDHTLGNISLLRDYFELTQSRDTVIVMLTDYGRFTPMTGERTFPSFPRQQVSLFSLTPGCRVTTQRLEYPIDAAPLDRLWQGTLNAALADSFSVKAVGGILLIYQTYDPKS